MELKTGGYTFSSFVPLLGALDMDRRSVYLLTNKDSYLIDWGDSFDSFYLEDYVLIIRDNRAKLEGYQYDWEVPASECLKSR